MTITIKYQRDMNSYFAREALGRTQARIYTSRIVDPTLHGRRDFAMAYGDRISVRVVVAGRTVAEYETRETADMTDLTGDIRRRLSGVRGLGYVYIRNHDRGWSRERRLMLYGERKHASARPVRVVQTPMFYPWEM